MGLVQRHRAAKGTCKVRPEHNHDRISIRDIADADAVTGSYHDVPK